MYDQEQLLAILRRLAGQEDLSPWLEDCPKSQGFLSHRDGLRLIRLNTDGEIISSERRDEP